MDLRYPITLQKVTTLGIYQGLQSSVFKTDQTHEYSQ